MLLLVLLFVLLLAVLGFMAIVDWRRRRLLPPNVRLVNRLDFFFGVMFVAKRNQQRIFDWILEQCELLGPTFAFFFPHRSQLMTCDPRNVEYMLKHVELYEKGPQFKHVLHELLGEGIFNTDGAQWLELRKAASHFFSAASLRFCQGVFVEHGLVVCDMLERAAAAGDTVELEDLFSRFTLDSFAEVAFGVNVGSLDADVPFSTAFESAMRNTMLRGFNPLWKVPLVGRWLKSERDLRRDVRIMDDFAYSIIDSRIANDARDSSRGELPRHDLLSLFLPTHANDRVYLRDLTLNFVIAGRDTTSSLLMWFIVEMAASAAGFDAHARRFTAELDAAGVGADGVCTYEQAKRLPLLKAAFLETLRLHPPVAKNAKELVGKDEDTLPDGTRITKGLMIVFMSYVLGRLPSLWGADAATWDPSRFTDAAEHERLKRRWFPFNAGPRSCLGERLAIIEASTMACLLLRRFRFRLARPLPSPAYTNAVTLKAPPGGIHVHVERL